MGGTPPQVQRLHIASISFYLNNLLKLTLSRSSMESLSSRGPVIFSTLKSSFSSLVGPPLSWRGLGDSAAAWKEARQAHQHTVLPQKGIARCQRPGHGPLATKPPQ